MTRNVSVRERESAKQRAGRIPLDYHRRATRLDAVKWWLTGVLGAAALSYSAWLILGTTRGWPSALRQISPGEVTAAHHAWNDRCETCHPAGTSLRDDATGVRWLNDMLGRRPKPAAAASSPNSSADDHCQSCHVAAPHHGHQIETEIGSCAGCHRDHRGQDVDLRRVADRRCTDCHRDIQAHRRSNVATSTTAPNVASWLDHPPSRSLKQGDPGNLRFNHRLHLLPGQYPRGAKESGPTRLQSIDRAAWARLGYADDASPDTIVQLDCAACHQTDEFDPGVAGESRNAPTSGASMRPIRFARHCAPCHSADLAASIPTDEGVTRGEIPHGLRANEVRRAVWGLASEPTKSTSGLTPPRPIPGRSGTGNASPQAGVALGPRVEHAIRELRGAHRCGKCHRDDIAPTAIPSVWMPLARFDHAAHRAVRCLECHPARPVLWLTDDKPPLDDRVPMIPDVDVCRRCHKTTTETGARTDCVECHDYHGADLAPSLRAHKRHALPAEKRLGASEWLSSERTSAGRPGSADSSGSP